MIAPHVGGAFGAKHLTAEGLVAVKVALELGRPVKWVETRSENLIAMPHGRGQVQYVELGLNRDGSIVGMHCRIVGDSGAYAGFGGMLPGMMTRIMASGCYRIPKIAFDVAVAITNTTSMGAYRGAGRPEAAAFLERIMDMAADELGIDPAELRRRNLVQPADFPYTTVMGAVYDSGDYDAALTEALRLADYEALRAEQAERRRRGDRLQLGIGMSVYVEVTGGGGEEFASVEVHDDGTVTVKAGTSAHGQGHATAFYDDGRRPPRHTDGEDPFRPVRHRPGSARRRHRGLPVPADGRQRRSRERRARARAGQGHCSRDVRVSSRGHRLRRRQVHRRRRAEQTLSSGPTIAQAAAEEGRARSSWSTTRTRTARPSRSAPMSRLSKSTWRPGKSGRSATSPSTTAAASSTRSSSTARCTAGSASGISQALWEQFVYDEDGNPLTTTLADYAIPSAAELPSFELAHTETPSPLNSIGAKGIGESATVGSTPAVQNAVVDALSHLGVRHLDMPCTPERIWRAIRDAESQGLASPWSEPPEVFGNLPVRAKSSEDAEPEEINL